LLKERYTIDNQKEIVVFVLGMRVHKLLQIHRWLPIMTSMSVMLRELYTNKQLGFLHGEFLFSWRGITLLQYWESYDHLEAYAYNDNHMHIWKYFNQNVAKRKAVGIFHETYLVEAQKYEAIYNHMPRFGLAHAMPLKQVDRDINKSRERLR